MALPDAACSGLLQKPLDTGIGWLLAPYRPSGRQGNRQTSKNQQMTLKRWPNRWPWQCPGKLPCTLPNGGGLGLSKMPLNATIGQVLRPIIAIGHRYAGFFRVFSSTPCYKRDRGDVKAPNNNRGMTYQTDKKEFTNTK